MASAFFYRGSLIEGLTSTPTSGGTLALNSGSEPYQILTGTLAHTVTLPDGTTLVAGKRFEITNASTQAVAVNDFGGNSLGSIDAGTTRIFRITDISTSNGVWDVTTASAGAGGLSASETSQFNALFAKGFSAQSKVLKLEPESLGGNYWLTRTGSITSKSYPAAVSLNGYYYSFGGYNAAILNINERYDDVNNSWLSRAVLPAARNNGAGVSADGFAYYAGGDSSASNNYQYNDQTNAWSSRTAPTSARGFPGSFSLQNTMYLFHGLAAGYTDQTSELYNNTANAWYSRSNLNYGARSSRGFVLNNVAYAVSGAAFAGPVANTNVFSEVTNIWRSSASLVNGAQNFAGFACNGFGYAAGGEKNPGPTYSTVIEEFSDASLSWKTKGNMPQRTGGGGRQPYGAVVSGFGITTGGGDSGTPTNNTDLYVNVSMISLGVLQNSSLAPTTIAVSAILNNLTPNVPIQVRTDGDNWKTFLSGTLQPKLGQSLSTLLQPSTSVYKVSGDAAGSIQTIIESYDESANAWRNVTNIATGKRGGMSFDADGFDYYVSGRTTGAASSATTDNIQFNSLSLAFVTKAPASTQRAFGAASYLNGYGYVVGGQNQAGTVIATNERYSPALNSWTTKTSIPFVRYSNAQFVVNGYMFGVGGNSGSFTYQDTEKYDDVTDSWSATAFPSDNEGASGAAINGYGYRIAGVNGGFLSSVQKYDPMNNSWSSAANVSTARTGAGAYRHNGSIYLVSGSNGAVLTSTEQYNPLNNSWTNRANVNTAVSEAGWASPNPYRNYEVRVGVPAFYPGFGGYQVTTGPSTNSTKSASGHACLNGRPFAFGGGSTTSEYLNVDLNSWVQFTPSNASGSVTGGWTLGGQAYHISDLFATAFTAAIDFYTRAWTSRTAPGNYRGRTGQGNGISLNGFGFITGGDDTGSGFYTNTERYNPATNSWNNSVGNLQTSQNCRTPGSQRVNGFWLLFGGYGATFPSNTNNVEMYNDVTQAWTSKNTYPINAIGVGSLTIDNSVVTLGGYNGSNLSNMYKYVFEFDSWLTLSNFPVAVSDMSTESVFGTMTGAGSTASYKITSAVKQAMLSAGLSVT